MSETVTTPTLRERIRPELWLRFGVAVVLGTAATLKTIEFSTSPVVKEGWLHSRELGIFAVNTELLMACLLIGGVLPKLTWLGTTAMFAVFSVVSGYLFLTGAESCNCFGRVLVPPLYTMLLDLTVVGLLLLLWPTGWSELRNEFFGLKKNVPFIVTFWLCLALPATYAMLSVQKNEVAELGTEFIGAGGRKTVLLEPEKWVGKELPLLPYIVSDQRKEEAQPINRRLKVDKWNIVLVRENCTDCAEFLKRLEPDERSSLVVSVVTDGNGVSDEIDIPGIKTFLKCDSSWIVPTPYFIHTVEGICTLVKGKN